jgi:hypothetical protein
LWISNDLSLSIIRVTTTNHFVVKTLADGIKLVTINDLKSQVYPVKLLDAQEYEINYNDSCQVEITPSQIVVATTQN